MSELWFCHLDLDGDPLCADTCEGHYDEDLEECDYE